MTAWRLLRSRLRTRLQRVVNSIWFYPVLLLAGATALFVLTTTLDEASAVSVAALDTGTLGDTLIFTGSPSAARSVLSAIASGWATILGAVFSVSLVVVQLTASNYTPQVLTEFEKDRLNQWTLGSFVGAITYALLVLRTVRTGEGGQTQFTPTIGTNVAIVWAVTDLLLLAIYIGNLISFIRPHRFVRSTVDSVIAALSEALAFRQRPGLEAAGPEVVRQADLRALARREVRAKRDGIVSRLAWDDLLAGLRLEMRRHLRRGRPLGQVTWCLRVERPTGASVTQGDVLAALEAPLADADLDRVQRALRQAFQVTAERRPEEDPVFGLDVLSAIAVRASSDGAAQVVAEAIDGLFQVLARIVGLPQPATHAVAQVDGARLIIVERPAVDLFEAAITALARAVDSALQRQLGAPLEELATRSAYLILREARAHHAASVRRLAEALLPLVRRALLGLREPHSVQAMVRELTRLLETLVDEGLQDEAIIVASAAELRDLQGRPEVAGPIGEALRRIRGEGE